MQKMTLFIVSIATAMSFSCGRDDSPSTTGETRNAHREPIRIPASQQEKPNLILITLDTLRADALGSYGQIRQPSPHIDRIGEEGVIFENAMTTNPETLPSHASIFTGQWPHHHGVRANAGFILPDAELTLAEILKQSGYRTAAEIAAPVLRKETRITQGFTHHRGALSRNVVHKDVPVKNESEKPNTRSAADITNRGLEFMKRYRGEPFFLWLHYFDAHNPYLAPKSFRDRFSESLYHAEVAYTDAQIGRLVHGLSDLGLDKNTFIMLTADHGEGLNEHGEPTHSYFVYNTTMRVPLIIWAPDRLQGGKRVSALARTIDILPTALDLLEIDSPDNLDGSSLIPLIEGEEKPDTRAAYGEATRFAATFNLPTLRYLRRGDWKYIHKTNPELYDLGEDPDETINLVAEYPDRVSAMREELSSLLATQSSASISAQAEIDAQIAAELIALGYVAHAPRMEIEAGESPLDLYGADPNSLVESAEAVAIAQGYLRRDLAQQALDLLESIRDQAPNSIHLLGLIGRALRDLDRTSEALEAYSAVLSLEPCEYKRRSEMSVLLREKGLTKAFLELLNDGVQACPLDNANQNDLAWALSTLPEEEFRDGPRAVAIMERVLLAGSDEPQPAYLDTLSAALAESGDFRRAAAVSRESLRLLKASPHVPPAVIEQVQGHLANYQEGRPIRDHAN